MQHLWNIAADKSSSNIVWTIGKDGILYTQKNGGERQPVKQFLLPPNKKFSKQKYMTPEYGVISISRDAHLFSESLDRLELQTNKFAKHIVIDRDGNVIQLASLLTPIKHLVGKAVDGTLVSNVNSVGIELINVGRLAKVLKNKIVSYYFSNVKFNSVVNVYSQDTKHYEKFPYEQYYNSLYGIMTALRQCNPAIKFTDCRHWHDMNDYRLTPAFPQALAVET